MSLADGADAADEGVAANMKRSPLRRYSTMQAKRRQHVPTTLSARERYVLDEALARQGPQRLVRTRVFARADGFCEVTLDGARCSRRPQDTHHVVKRSQGGEDSEDNEVALCRPCHDQTDYPYQRGRLVVTALGAGQFRFAVQRAPDKFAYEEQAQRLLAQLPLCEDALALTVAEGSDD